MRPSARARALREAVSYCRQPDHLRRTLSVAVVVGVLLTAVNQLEVILDGHAGAGTWIRCAANFLIPFVVSNLGLLSGRPQTPRGD